MSKNSACKRLMRSGRPKRLVKNSRKAKFLQRVCKSKKHHPNFTSAHRHAVRLNIIYKKKEGEGWHAYKCQYCNFFHVGHSNRS